MMRFVYQMEPLTGPPPPSLPQTASARWRPYVPITVIGRSRRRRGFSRALLDTGADDSVFPLDTAARIGAVLRADTGHRVRWRGQLFPLYFGDVELVLTDGHAVWQWPAVVAFSSAPLAYPLLGNAGCLEYFDANFRGPFRVVDLDTGSSYPGTSI